MTFSIPDSAAPVVVDLNTHDVEPALLAAAEGWVHVEQGGAEFGYLPVTVQPLVWSSQREHDRIVGPVLASIAGGWNMVRVSCRDRRPHDPVVKVCVDIWPIPGPAGLEVIRYRPSGSRIQPESAEVQERVEAAVTIEDATSVSGPLDADHLANLSLLIRGDFSDPDGWTTVANAVLAPDPVDGFTADLTLVDDPTYDSITGDELADAIGEPPPFYVFLCDTQTLSHPDHPILAINLDAEDTSNRSVRVMPAAMWSIENNLALGNMDFADFVGAADTDGIFRGF
ncbi:DUF6924 domain-containing protein [Gordonia polyisoprenivorans]|uniref:DUF6924 domain-containing protein n=1 Tax=Gordonia polyisoprenivorans TaxID=84595 RepID=UPI0022FFE0C2|nr:hypothetical protein [Gordonia polyisoprenivorans]WCB39482.1 hypothetical protein PHA63_10425 [Gordonia polyisoprenivorans]